MVMGGGPTIGGEFIPRFYNFGRVGSYRLLKTYFHTDFLRPFQLTQSQTLIPLKIMTLLFYLGGVPPPGPPWLRPLAAGGGAAPPGAPRPFVHIRLQIYSLGIHDK